MNKALSRALFFMVLKALTGNNKNMTRRRRRKLATPPTSNSTLMMNLCLFIMLLAFFIVINARSSFEEDKKESTIKSIEKAFSTNVIRQDISPSVAPDPYESIRDGDTTDRIEALFRSQIASFRPTENDHAGEFITEIPLEEFSSAIMSIGQQNLLEIPSGEVREKFFLPTLVSILKSEKAGAPYRMDITILTKDNPAVILNRRPEEIAAFRKRGAEWARQLEKAGMTQKLISFGVKEGRAGYVELSFRPHVPFSPVREGSR